MLAPNTEPLLEGFGCHLLPKTTINQKCAP